MDEPEFLRNLELGESRVWSGVNWDGYLELCEHMTHRRLRTTYCDNEFEIMPASFDHEKRLYMIESLFFWFAMEMNIHLRSTGSATIRSADLRIAIEPDRSYYLSNWKLVPLDRDFDLTRDPPPDLVIEVDIPDCSKKRMRVLAALGVREVWRYDDRKMCVYLLLGNGEYIESDRSDCCPLLPMTAIERFVPMQDKMDDNAVVREFGAWME